MLAGLLLADGCPIDVVGEQGYTALHFAVSNGDTDMVRYLLEHKASPFARTDDGRTPLHIAAGCSDSESMLELLSWGANPNALSDVGKTPLHHVFWDSSPEMKAVQVLLQFGADPTIKDSTGQTPLDKSAKARSEPIRLLMSSAAKSFEPGIGR
ncbi:MAG: ankyrin repeat domain-containing protein [Chthoniobacteraceae bacterium]